MTGTALWCVKDRFESKQLFENYAIPRQHGAYAFLSERPGKAETNLSKTDQHPI